MPDAEIAVKASAFELYADHVFLDRQLLFDAIASRGYPNEHLDFKHAHRQPVLSNMGDAVIDVLCTEFLIVEKGIADEGQITLVRTRMVKGSSLNELARPILPFLALSAGERNELERSSTPAESLEALVGALYLDGGLPAAKSLLTKLGFFEKEY
jgi:ribonuclease-3